MKLKTFLAWVSQIMQKTFHIHSWPNTTWIQKCTTVYFFRNNVMLKTWPYRTYLWNLAGWIMQLNFFLYVKRNWREDQVNLSQFVDYYQKLDYDYRLVLFPEGTDLSEQNLRRSEKFAHSNNMQVFTIHNKDMRKVLTVIINAESCFRRGPRFFRFGRHLYWSRFSTWLVLHF